MEITEVRIKLMLRQNDKLRAFCSITLDDDFVIRDLKVIEGPRGPFVAMPSRKLMERCPGCTGKNHHRAAYCNDCGMRLPPARDRAAGGPPPHHPAAPLPCPTAASRPKLHADIAHPINTRAREFIQKRILEHYAAEVERSMAPDYKPLDLDVFDEECLGEESDSRAAEGLAPGAFEPAPSDRPPPAMGGLPRIAVWSEGGGGGMPFHSGEAPGRTARGGPERPGASGLQEARPGSDRAAHGPSRVSTGRASRDDGPGKVDRASRGIPGPSSGEKRLPAREPEPEDNFGAGLFS